MAHITKDNSGSLWKNSYKESEEDKKPNFTGEVRINDKLMRVAAWNNTTKAGKEYIGMVFEETEEKEEEEVPF